MQVFALPYAALRNMCVCYEDQLGCLDVHASVSNASGMGGFHALDCLRKQLKLLCGYSIGI